MTKMRKRRAIKGRKRRKKERENFLSHPLKRRKIKIRKKTKIKERNN